MDWYFEVQVAVNNISIIIQRILLKKNKQTLQKYANESTISVRSIQNWDCGSLKREINGEEVYGYHNEYYKE